jgi:predicted Rossmann-fold nucleotide-binding protein
MRTHTHTLTHASCAGLLNINGYFNGLIELFAHMIESGFVHEKWSDLLVVEADPKTLLDRLLVHEPPMSTINWITPEES